MRTVPTRRVLGVCDLSLPQKEAFLDRAFLFVSFDFLCVYVSILSLWLRVFVVVYMGPVRAGLTTLSPSI